MMSRSDLIVSAGRALWGDRWQAEMARALSVHKDTVQDWRQGRAVPRNGVFADLLAVMDARRAAVGALIDEVREVAHAP